MRKMLIPSLVLAVLVLISCGGQPGTGGGGGNGGGEADPAKMASVLSSASTQLFQLEKPLLQAGIPVPLFGMPLSRTIAPLTVTDWNCSHVSVTGNTSDADGDGIPLNATYNGSCSWSYSDAEGSISGSWQYHDVNVQDPNDRDPQAGVKVKGRIDWSLTTSDGSVSINWTIVQHDMVKQGNNTYKFNFKGNWTMSGSGAMGAYNFDYNLGGTWTPDSASSLWKSGTMAATGRFSGNGPSCPGWSASVNINNLHYSSCGVDSGSASYTVHGCQGGSTCTATVTWTGCDNPSVSGGCVGR